MCAQSAPEHNRAVGLTGVGTPVPWRVERVEVLDSQRLHVRFRDGLVGEVDLSRLLASPQAGVFAPLRDPDAFRAVAIEMGAVTWPGGLDLAPDAMHHAIRETGRYVP